MTREEFERLVEEEFPNAIPEQFRKKIKNVAFLIEEQPSPQLRRQERLSLHETLLGFYHGVPATARGDSYGLGATLPDTITLFQLPIEEEAHFLMRRSGAPWEESVRRVIRDTMWHEVAHHFGFDEKQVRQKEVQRRNAK